MQAILPAFALSLYLTDGGDGDDDNSRDGGDGGNNNERDAEGLLLLVVGRYSLQVSWMWRVFYLDYLYHDISLVEQNSHHFYNFPRKNIWFDSWTPKKCVFTCPSKRTSSFRPTVNLVLHILQPITTDLCMCLQDFDTTALIPMKIPSFLRAHRLH